MKGGSHLRENFPVILVFQGAAPVAVPMRPPDMRPGRAMRTRRAGHFIIFSLLLPLFHFPICELPALAAGKDASCRVLS